PDPPLVALLEEAIAAWYGRDSGLHARALARLAAALFFGDGARRSELVKRAVAMARRVGDPATLRYVLMRRLFASILIDELDERLATAAELVEAAERARDLDVLAQGRVSHGSILLERGDIRGFAWSAAALERLASDLRKPVWSWYARVQSAAAAAIEGRFEEAERAANEARAIGQEALPYAAPAYFASQMLMLRVLQGRAAELVPAYRAIADRIPDPRGRLPLLFAEVELGNEEEAGRFLEQQLGHCFGAERDTMWLLSLGFLA